MFTGGASIVNATEEHTLNFQTQILRSQIALEDSFVNLARTTAFKQTFVLCDRGTCDGRAYMTPKLWTLMLEENNWDMVSIRDARYDLVVHLVTAADGAQDHYSLANNKVRSESPEEACRVDQRTQAAWVGHPHLRIVDNRSNFHNKIHRVDALVSELAGLHLVPRVVRKFLLRRPFDREMEKAAKNSLEVAHFSVEQTFLQTGLSNDVQESIRRRGANGIFTYVHKRRQGESETKRQITRREYANLIGHKDPERSTIEISRKCFLYKGRYFILDHIANLIPELSLLRCHCDEKDEVVDIPEWIDVNKEVTGEKAYSMHTIATRVQRYDI